MEQSIESQPICEANAEKSANNNIACLNRENQEPISKVLNVNSFVVLGFLLAPPEQDSV